MSSSSHPNKGSNEKIGEITCVDVQKNSSSSQVNESQPVQKLEVSGWPDTPQRIRISRFWLIGDLFLLVLPIGFIGTSVCFYLPGTILTLTFFSIGLAVTLDQAPLSRKGGRVQEAMLLAPTIFPLMFAAIGGRALKRIALWKAERGTSLGTLEQLLGSQTLVSTVVNALNLRFLGLLPCLLLVLWVLSPLGGQSALRLLHETNSTASQTKPVFYANFDSLTDFTKQSYNADAANRANGVLSASLLTADTLEFSPVDAWNHPKIPRIEALESDDANNSSNWQWYDADESQANITYAALTGVSLMALEGASSNFTIPYQYMYYNCSLSPRFNESYIQVTNEYLMELQQQNLLDGPYTPLNSTSWSSYMYRGFFIWGIINNQTAEKLLYGSQRYSATLYLFECSMNSVAVEADISCVSDMCKAKRVRRLKSPRPKRDSGATWDAAHGYYTFDAFIRHLSKIGGDDALNMGNVVRNPADLYVYGGSPWGKDLTGMGLNCDWTQYILDPSQSIGMSRRLTKMLNTFWDASRWPVAISRNDPHGKLSLNQTSYEAYDIMTMNKTEAFLTWPFGIYRVSKGWVAALFLCSSMLFLLGLASLLLSLSTDMPDIFQYVSSLTRDNPYVSVPQGGSFLNGADRARLLRKLPVHLGDVTPADEIGYIALKTMDGKQAKNRGRISKERVYR